MRRLVTFSFYYVRGPFCLLRAPDLFLSKLGWTGRLGVATVYPGLRGGLLLHAVDHHRPPPACRRERLGGCAEPVGELHPVPLPARIGTWDHAPPCGPTARRCIMRSSPPESVDPFNPNAQQIYDRAAAHVIYAAAGVRLDSAGR